MEYLDKIEQLFKANEIVLAVQLCKSQGYDLRKILNGIIKSNSLNGIHDDDTCIWPLNQLDYMDDLFTGISTDNNTLILWLGFIDDNFECTSIDECLDKLAEELYKLCK